jgi:hypothetical protein
MTHFRISDDVLFAVNLREIALVNVKTGNHQVIRYPEAAVWSVLAENNKMGRSEKMLQAILGKNPTETRTIIARCLKNWKGAGIID